MAESLAEGLEVTGPAGIGVKFHGSSGQNFMLLLAIFVCVCIFGVAVWQDARATARSDEVKKSLTAYEESQRALIYVISLPQPEREKLNLAKPELLRRMQNP